MAFCNRISDQDNGDGVFVNDTSNSELYKNRITDTKIFSDKLFSLMTQHYLKVTYLEYFPRTTHLQKETKVNIFYFKPFNERKL